jgi:hypothetical protein
MKNILNGRRAAALFVAPFLLFGIQMASCGGNGAESQALGSNGGKALTTKAVLTCVGISCPTLTLYSTDSSHGGGPKLYEGLTDSAIAAGTRIRVTVYLNDSLSH